MEAKLKPNTIVGIFIIIIGSLFLLKNFGVLPQEFFWKIFGWQAIIILIGIILIVIVVIFIIKSKKNNPTI